LLTLKKHLGDICTLIDGGSAEPEGIALLILDAIPEEQDEKFYSIVADENYMLKLTAVEPRVRQHAEFFSKVRARILQEFAEDAGADTRALDASETRTADDDGAAHALEKTHSV
jgi:hypothetical protein